MNYFVIGDIHGCYYSFLELLKHWDREQEVLVCVGDFIDRGNYSVLVVEECRRLEQEFPKGAVFLKGNHEAELIEHVEVAPNDNWLRQCGQKTLDELHQYQMDIRLWSDWFKNRPLIYETPFVAITHAGISATATPFEENNDSGVLWNREPLKNIGKLQIHGHTPLRSELPEYTALSNSWNIDTGVYYGFGLTGMRISNAGVVLEIVNIPTDCRDVS